MDVLEVQDAFKKEVADLERCLEGLKNKYEVRIEEARNNEILKGLAALGVRLTAIEERFKREDALKYSVEEEVEVE